MNIAFFSDTFYPLIDGISTSILNTAQELGRRGHQVRIFAPSPSRLPPHMDGRGNVQVIRLPSMPALVAPDWRLGVFTLPKSLMNVRKFRPDVIHFHTMFSMGLDAFLAAKIFGIPLIGTNHVFITRDNAQSICILPGMLRAEKHIARAALSYLGFLYDACDVRLTPSTLLIESIRKEGFSKPYIHLPNGVAMTGIHTLSRTERIAFRKKYRLQDRVVLHVGRLVREKNVEDVIRSFALLKKKMPSVSLLLIGDGQAAPMLRKLAKSLDIARDVVFTGMMKHDELLTSGIIGVGDLFVTASRMENHPMVVLEAMSHGLPIVGVREAGMIDLVGKAGILTKAGDHDAMAKAMQKILERPLTVTSMIRQSRKTAQSFSIETVTDRLLKLYRGVIRKKSRLSY